MGFYKKKAENAKNPVIFGGIVMAKILLTATVQSHIAQFHKPVIRMLQEMGHQVDVAAKNNLHEKKNLTLTEPDAIHEVAFCRSPFSLQIFPAYQQLKKLIREGNYDVVHCNTPVAGILTRLACRKLRKQGEIKVLYEAHGLHFFKGGPRSGWLIWYPIEKFFSRFADMMVLINRMDYALVQEKFHTKLVRVIPGIGVNLSQFQQVAAGDLRGELHLDPETPIILSVGELNENKNHKTVITALSMLKNKNAHYCIAGNGPLLQELQDYARSLQVGDRVHFLGYRRDVPVLLHQADIFVLPSRREGLGMAAIEAMSCGLPLISSNRHGINDYSIPNVTGYQYDPADSQGFAQGIDKLLSDGELREKFGENCKEIAQKFTLEESLNCMRNYYLELMKHE